MVKNQLIIECRKISKTFKDGNITVNVLRDVNFSVQRGEQIAIIGKSGSGKSTLLHILGGLSEPSKGKVIIDGENIHSLSDSAKGKLRNEVLGFIYQFHHLLPEFTSLENVAMPLLIRKTNSKTAFHQAKVILERVELENRLYHKPGELSGGERQRVAVARAIVTRPRCVMADEPTGNLDSQSLESVQTLMFELNREFQISLVIVTHDIHLANKMQKIFRIQNGQLFDQ